eukprot:2499339-Karenia_brevis.AAC.1
MNDLLKCIEEVGEMYGLRLDKSKCDLIRFNGSSRVMFRDGAQVPLKQEARYLGCWLNNKGDPARELKTRMTATEAIWKKLHHYFLHSVDSCAFKLQ